MPVNRTRLLVVFFTAMFTLPAPSLGLAQQGNSSADRALVFGILPILSTEKLVARFGPMTDYMAQKLGRPVVFETAAGYAEFARRTNKDKRYDILFTAPHFYYIAQREAGYQVIVRVAGPSLAALIVASKSSGIKSVAELKGRSIAVPDSLSLGNLLIRNHLALAGLRDGKDIKLVETPSHNAALLSATKGNTDAAGLMVPPYRRSSAEIKNKMQIIATTRGTPHMPFSVAARLSPADKERIRQVLLDMPKDAQGQALLKQMAWPGFVATTPAEYDQMEWAADLIPH